MAIVLPSGFENLGPDLGRLGDALTRTFAPTVVRDMEIEQAVLANPALGQMLAASFRQNPEAGRAFGISPEMMGRLNTAFAPTIEEQLGAQLSSDPGYISSLVESAKIQPQRDVAVGRAEISGANFQEQLSKGMLSENIPMLQAAAQAGALQEAVQQTNFNLELGLPKARALAEAVGLDLSTEQGRLGLENINQYREWIKQLSPHMRGAAVAGMVNPNLLQHITFHEQLSLEERMMRLKASGSQEEKLIEGFKIYRDLRAQVTDAIDRAREADEEGNTQDKRAAIADLQGVAQWNRALVGAGFILPTPVITAEERDKLIGMDIDLPIERPDFKGLAAQFLAAGGTPGEVLTGLVEMGMAEEEARGILGGLLKGEAEADEPEQPRATTPRASTEQRQGEREEVLQRIQALINKPNRTGAETRELMQLDYRVKWGDLKATGGTRKGPAGGVM